MTFEQWAEENMHAIDDMVYAKEIWQASQAQQAQTIAELVEALERIEGWLEVRHLGGLMPNEKALIAKVKGK